MTKYKILFYWIFILLFFVPVVLVAQQITIEKVRDQFFSIHEVKDGALNLYFRLKLINVKGNPVLLAYRGAASAASAGSVGGVNKKLQYFSNGKAELEEAIKLEPGNMEIRFLRLATQLNAPAFLGYRGAIDEDKGIIINKLCLLKVNDANAYLYYRISDFLLNSNILNSGEKAKILLCKEKYGK